MKRVAVKHHHRIQKAIRQAASRSLVLGPLVFLIAAGAGCPSLFESAEHRAVQIKQAVVGRDGARTINAANTEVNLYAQLGGSTDPVAGDRSLTVNDVNGDFLSAVAAGDLLLIIQMQGAIIDISDTAGYGAFTTTDLGSAGRYEFVGVDGVAGGVISLACGLKNSYLRAGHTQVIRVPQYTTLTINSGASITAPTWNGVTGGVVAVHAQSTVNLSGSINVVAKGFRGGSTTGDNASQAADTDVEVYRSAVAADGAEKGESIAGYQADYTNGRYGRGAPANGGGGGNSHNAGGGGGANAAGGATWTGQGVMTGCSAGSPGAWALDSAYVNSTCANSPGGGRGGYSYSANSQDPLTVGPGVCTGGTSWGGNCRREIGGLGGRPVPSDPASRLFLGGGGGAGDGNNSCAGSGGNGGGLVFIIAGQVTGTGSILAGGGDGANATFANGDNTGGDSPGGGGGGGTVVVNATSLSAIAINVNGGRGGNHVGSSGTYEVEGPGGGGGGGYVAVSGAGPVVSAAGGLAGTTDKAVMSTFAVDGATAGNAGITNGSSATFLYCGVLPVTTIATHPTDPSASSTGSFTFTNTVSPVTYECKIDSGAWGACTTPYTTATLADGEHTLTVRATDSHGNVEATPPTFTWTINASALVTTIATHPEPVANTSTGTFTFTNATSPVTYQCKIDNGAWAACTTPFTTATLADGSHTLSVRATDTNSTVEDPPVTFTWIIDTVAPNTTITSNPANPSGSSVGGFTFGSNENPVTYQCKLDQGMDAGVDAGSDWATCPASYTTPSLADGSHTLQVRAVDAAGNVDTTPAVYTWLINTDVPVTTIATHPSKVSNSPTGVFTFTNTRDPSVSYECQLDTGAWAPCPASYTTPSLADGPHTLSVRGSVTGLDAGNLVEDPPVVYTWTIDTVAPDTSIVDHPTDPSSSATGGFTFGSNENPVTYQCKLDQADWTDCPSSYDTPALGNGPHTLQVRAIDAAGNTDATPVTFTWTIAVTVALDGGTSGSLDGGVVLDGAVVLDSGALDGQSDDAMAPIDVASVDDVQPSRPETNPTGAEPGPDTAPAAPEPNRDAAVTGTPDSAITGNADAATTDMPNRLRGAGFCAIAATRATSPAVWALLALAGLVVTLRRRRR
jgi:hypothetical protein